MSYELYHHGIKGQRWGVRRYQNEDGTLTSAGQARYNANGKRKNAKDMSDDDLRKSNKRLSAEQQYNNLSGRSYRNHSSANDIAVRAGASAVGSFLVVAGGKLARDAIKKNSVDVGKENLKSAASVGLLASAIATITTITSSFGGQINKEGKK